MSEKRRKKRINLILFLMVDILLIAMIYLLVVSKPAKYVPNEPIVTNEVSPYLTHELGEDFFNGISKGETFALNITDEGVNDILRRADWPIDLGVFKLYSASVSFSEAGVKLTGEFESRYLKTILTADCKAGIDKNRLMSLEISQIKAGRLPIDWLVMPMMKKAVTKNLANIQDDSINKMIANSIFESVPFEPTIDLNSSIVIIRDIRFYEGFAAVTIEPVRK